LQTFFADLTEDEKQLLAKILIFKQQLVLDIQVGLPLCIYTKTLLLSIIYAVCMLGNFSYKPLLSQCIS